VLCRIHANVEEIAFDEIRDMCLFGEMKLVAEVVYFCYLFRNLDSDESWVYAVSVWQYVFALSIEIRVEFCPAVLIGGVADHDGRFLGTNKVLIRPIPDLPRNSGMKLGDYLTAFGFGSSDTFDEFVKAGTAMYVSVDLD
jgi:hypothetical protein